MPLDNLNDSDLREQEIMLTLAGSRVIDIVGNEART